jgi:DNA-directed RNA polymerase specialized sigma24 family protein
VPEQERAVFELIVLQGFSKEEVARIYNIVPDEVQRIVDRVRAQVRSEMKKALEGGEETGRKTS